MCQQWAAGLPCSFGKNCNYAHGHGQLKKFLAIQAQAGAEKAEKSPGSNDVDSDKIEPKKVLEQENVSPEGKPEWVAQLIRNSNKTVQQTKSTEIQVELITSNNENFPKISDKEDNLKDDNYGSEKSNLSTQRGTDQEGEKFSDTEADYGLSQLNIEAEEERGSVVVVSPFNDSNEQVNSKIRIDSQK